MLKTPSLYGQKPQAKRQEIRAYFEYCYKRYDSLFTLLRNDEAYYQTADALRHPLIFYYGHTATFFINKLTLAKLIDQRIDPTLESLFAVGVDEMSWDDLNQTHYAWASVEKTQAYRDKVYEVVLDLIDTLPLELPITQSSPWWVILMGIEHENIHLETSSVLIRQLPLASVVSRPLWESSITAKDAPQNSLIDVPQGEITLGKSQEDDFFGWDNEYGTHQAKVSAFKASKYLVSNGEYLAFVKEGGYEDSRFWCEEGNAWRAYSGAKHPLFWSYESDGYWLRTLTQKIPLPLNLPVEVNHLEASAFCRYKSLKTQTNITLPTEDEYERLRAFCGVDESEISANINLDEEAFSVGVDTHKQGEFYDVVGNVWQWSRTPIYPFRGFNVHPIYDDFTVPTFDGKHMLIKGGSWISCGNLALQKSRYAFRRHFYQHAGFRYIESHYKESIEMDYYTKDKIVTQYCQFGWGENTLGVANYPEACAKLALEAMRDRPKRKAFDIGCAIGRSSFELAREFDEVVGVDFSARFIQEAQKLKEDGILRYTMTTEGELEAFYEVDLEKFDLAQTRDKVDFWQADACNLKPIYKDFDLIFAGNLLDRLYEPKQFLEDLAHRLNDNGTLILTSPYTWQEESTPKEKWIGGIKKDGENLSTLDGLKQILGEDFELIETKDVPFVIQETARKHQHTIAQMSIWQKR